MHVSIELSRGANGAFHAVCPELGLRSCDTDQRKALARLTGMIFDYMNTNDWQHGQELPGPACHTVVVRYADGCKVICNPRYLAIN